MSDGPRFGTLFSADRPAVRVRNGVTREDSSAACAVCIICRLQFTYNMSTAQRSADSRYWHRGVVDGRAKEVFTDVDPTIAGRRPLLACALVGRCVVLRIVDCQRRRVPDGEYRTKYLGVFPFIAFIRTMLH